MILPQPDPAFEWQQTAFGPALVCRPLVPYARHLFTTRAWSLGSRQVARDDERPWDEIATAFDVGRERLARLHQVHGAEAVEALPGAPIQSADIVVGDTPALALAVQSADCVPLLIVDVHLGAVAAAHAGWRGLAAGVPARAVEALGRCYGSSPENLIAAAGPSIGACCYEVGDDVRQAFVRAGFGPLVETWFLKRRPHLAGNPGLAHLPASADAHHWFFDGWRCAQDQLEECGLSRARIFSPHLCTASHADVFCSYRRDGVSAGRMAAVVAPAPVSAA